MRDALITAILAATVAITAVGARPAMANDVKTCCHISGACVVIKRYAMCPRGYF